MENGVWYLVAVLSLAAAVLLVRWLVLRHALRELTRQLEEHLTQDTNTLLTIPTSDPSARQLTAALNRQLAALRTERRRLQYGDAELKAAITGLSHDLRTPLTALRGYLGLLAAQPLSDPARRYVSILQERTDAMTQLTEELFRYSVATTADAPLHLEPVCLNDALAESLAAHYEILTARNIQPRIELPPCPVNRLLDKAALGRILDNLLNNAVKYAQGELDVTLTAEGCLRFTNAAPGLDAVDAQQLFHRFYTVQNAHRSTGLGLAIAKTLTQQMGGRITAQVQDGQLTVEVEFR